VVQIARKLRSRFTAYFHDSVMIVLAWLGAFWLRFNFTGIPEWFLSQALQMVPVLVVVQGGVFWYLGLYRGVWRFASMPDLIRIVQSVVIGVSLSAVAVFMLTRMEGIPRTVFPLYGLLLVIFLGGPRLLYRWLKERRLSAVSDTKVLIVGAGRAGEMLIRELLRDRSYGYHPVAFVDDAPAKRGWDIHGVRVMHDCEHIPDLAVSYAVDLILLAIPSATSRQMRRIVSLCEKANVPFRTLPRIQDLVAGRSALRELREVSIEDLLGREPVSLDWASINAGMKDRVILVSGGGGSIGAELCRQIARLKPTSLHVLDNSEYNLYEIDMELRKRFPELTVGTRIADVCDADAIDHIVRQIRPGIVFHAAAYKHVPLLEYQVREAVRNNVLGTQNMATAAAAHGVESFVLISTDKAVNPTSVMGASKRVAEILCQNMHWRFPGTRFVTVRFGNVLDSAGSVVPLFRRQIEQGGPVTVTDPDVKRYFMTIPEACQLILEAGAVGKGGEVFVLDMGEPIKIRYLAEQMIVLAGKSPGEDVEIQYTGLRPGEKLYEELFHGQENLTATGRDKLLLARYRPVDWNSLSESVSALRRACSEYDEAKIHALLLTLVPEYTTPPVAAESNVIPLDQAKR
jgi:FlaA1/EpsC-like NDP-sugar epimerase